MAKALLQQHISDARPVVTATRRAVLREAAVLVLLRDDVRAGTLLTLIRRAGHLRSHPGEIALPGGAREGRESLARTALRETEEEIGVDPGEVLLAGRLAAVDIGSSGYRVHPFVGRLRGRPRYRRAPDEVAEILEIPLDCLRCAVADDPGCVSRPRFEVGDVQVLGATARMLAELALAPGPARAPARLRRPGPARPGSRPSG